MMGDCANCNCSHMCYVKGKSCVPVDVEAVKAAYTADERKMMEAAAWVEGTFYRQHTRLEEIVDFGARMGYRKIGLAFCIGLRDEARLFARYLSKHFEVVSICCKNCGIGKRELGLQQIDANKERETMCNPKNQAKHLNEQHCELAVAVGLCVGHDSIFYANCEMPVTTLVTKDRVLSHNPCGAVYASYWRRKLGIDP